ncbi:hypothetical protein ACSX1A_00840 [Pontibacter sp. MBLB2868]|uniref:hypothetical protein n=1 Tax=Pontibacter sp. MBLB2868 TaxID=3451555 RepID=UPI003F74C29F
MNSVIFVLNIGLLSLLVWALWKRPVLNEIRPFVLPGLFLKLACGIALGLLYHHYYQEGDTLTFKNASLHLSAYAKENPVAYIRLLLFNEFSSDSLRASLPFTRFPNFSNSFFFLKLLSALNLLTNNSYYLNSLYLSLFSFWGTAMLVATLVRLEPTHKQASVIAFFFFPTVVFWSSGVLKDPLVFGSMCWLVAIALQLAAGKSLSKINWLLLPLMLYLFIRIKFFLALLLLPLLLLYGLVKIIARQTSYLNSMVSQLLAMLLLAVAFGLLGATLVAEYDNAFFYHNLVYTYQEMLELSVGQPHIVFRQLDPNLTSMLANAPEALFGAIFRPFVWEAINPLHLLMGLENLILMALTALFVSSLFTGRLKLPTMMQLLFILVVVAFGVIIGLTTPNFGTLSRYRIAFLPFLVYLLLQNRYAKRLLLPIRK